LLSGNKKETISPERISATRGARQTIPGLQNYETGIYVFAFPLKADIEKAPENLQMELINLQCDTNLNQKFLKQNCKIFILTCQNKYFLYSGLLGLLNDCNARQHVCV
jgi:hypothetical protein